MLSSRPAPAQQEDPSITAQRQAEAQRANDDKIRATQQQLRLETQQANGNVGIASLLGPLGGGAVGRRLLTSLLGSG